ncbi:MAG: lipoyl(octanoyl) transferase LipB [Betaproteobacteria bacterium]|nr:lipoyl(octanoyl) transferase LipB [Betaproteobacteria bacterium]
MISGHREAVAASRLSPLASPAVRRLGLADYEATWRAMQDFTASRDAPTRDELWLLEHPPVYTLGIAGKSEHLPRVANGIPVIRTDRGGQITYHGPGQLVAYLLLDMRRRGLSVRPLVRLMECAVIGLLAEYGIAASGRTAAPGVYVGNAKVAALGLRIRRGCCYHGLALNVDMDLSPFHAINPCGFPGLEVTQTRDLGVMDSPDALGTKLIDHLLRHLEANGTTDKHR